MVKRIVRNFNTAGLDYIFTGALAASYYGTPRTTMDIDIVVKVTHDELRTKLVPALRKAELRINEEKIDAALKSEFRIATFEDSKSPFTVDIIFSTENLRKKVGSILGLPTFYQTPEDLIRMKLRMIKATVLKERALKDIDDIRAILRFTEVDMKNLKRQALKDSTLAILKDIANVAT